MAPFCKLKLARFSAKLKIQDGAECGINLYTICFYLLAVTLLTACSQHAQTLLTTYPRIALKLLWACLQFAHSKFSSLSQVVFKHVRFFLLYLLLPSDPQLPPSTPWKLSYSLKLSLEDFPSVQQAMLPCSAGYATLFSKLCYPVQQAMLPCSAGYATLFSRLC